MSKEKDILIIENIASYEQRVNKDPSPSEIEMMVMPGTLQDQHKNLGPKKGVQALRLRFNLIHLILEGEHDVHIGAEYRWLQPNDLVIVPENMVYSANHPHQCQGYCLHFKTEFIQPLLHGPLASVFPFLDAEADHVIKLNHEACELTKNAFSDLITEYDRFTPERDNLLKNYLHILLLRIRSIYNPKASNNKEIASHSTKLANQFKHLVEENFLEIREVKQYADILNISPGHLSDTVKKIFGKSPREIINTVLLLEAKVLLGTSDKNISEIAHYLRFEDQSHFNHFVKHHTGIAPKELRKIL